MGIICDGWDDNGENEGEKKAVTKEKPLVLQWSCYIEYKCLLVFWNNTKSIIKSHSVVYKRV